MLAGAASPAQYCCCWGLQVSVAVCWQKVVAEVAVLGTGIDWADWEADLFTAKGPSQGLPFCCGPHKLLFATDAATQGLDMFCALQYKAWVLGMRCLCAGAAILLWVSACHAMPTPGVLFDEQGGWESNM